MPELNGCIRRGVYEITNWEDKELHDPKVQLIFDEGKNQEKQVLSDMAEAGIEVIEQQSQFTWKEYNISGHIDGVILEDGVAIPIEIKSMHPNIYTQVNSFEDLKKKPWLQSYMAQITIYMLMKNIDKAVFIFKNKSTGELKTVDVKLDYALGEACLKTAEEIKNHIEKNTVPKKTNDREVCKKCPFNRICLPNLSFGEPLKLSDDPVFEKKIDDYLENKGIAEKTKNLLELIRSEAQSEAGKSGQLNMIIGKYHLNGKKDTRGTFRLKIERV